MNKLVTVLGVAAVATLAGCKDPDYKPMSQGSQTEGKDIVLTPDVTPAVAPEVEKPTCACPPGTKHYKPCQCGADDCACVVVAKPRPVAPPPPAPVAAPATATAEPVYTVYVVRSGDHLAKISKKFNVKIEAIKRLNGLEKDTIRVGQKLKIPGVHDVGPQPAPAVASAKVAKQFTPYRGATKEYVVKSGDTLGKIAYGHGCNIRQLKELNGLKGDDIRVGRRLKVPADGKAVAVAAKPDAAKPAAPAVATKPDAAKPAAPVAEPPVANPESAPAPVAEPVAAPEPAPEASAATYVVQEGDDMTGVSIRFGVSAAAIRELNNLPEGAQLTPGQIIKLPAEAQQ